MPEEARQKKFGEGGVGDHLQLIGDKTTSGLVELGKITKVYGDDYASTKPTVLEKIAERERPGHVGGRRGRGGAAGPAADAAGRRPGLNNSPLPPPPPLPAPPPPNEDPLFVRSRARPAARGGGRLYEPRSPSTMQRVSVDIVARILRPIARGASRELATSRGLNSVSPKNQRGVQPARRLLERLSFPTRGQEGTARRVRASRRPWQLGARAGRVCGASKARRRRRAYLGLSSSREFGWVLPLAKIHQRLTPPSTIQLVHYINSSPVYLIRRNP